MKIVCIHYVCERREEYRVRMARAYSAVIFLVAAMGSCRGFFFKLLQPMESSWETTLPNKAVSKESAKLFDRQRLVYITSNSVNLVGAGFTSSVSLYDFNTGNVGIRLDLPSGKQACFMSSIGTTYNNIKKELLHTRTTAREIETSVPKTFTAEQQNRLNFSNLLAMSVAMKRHCLQALIYNNVFHLTQNSPVKVKPSSLKVSGLLTDGHKELSVPYHIFLENSVLLN